jgi:imidazoleglycerol phosphate synthase glutamine amidotransferase subunit HisH
MENLVSSGLAEAIKIFPRPVLGICLGMQLMASLSEEGRTPGLGFFLKELSGFSMT